MKRFLKAVPFLLVACLLCTPPPAASRITAASISSTGPQTDATGVYNVRAFGAKGSTFVLRNVEDFSLQQSRTLPDTVSERAPLKRL